MSDDAAGSIASLVGWNRTVHQAVGMVSVQIGAGLLEAAEQLVARSHATGRSLEWIAVQVVGRRVRFD